MNYHGTFKTTTAPRASHLKNDPRINGATPASDRLNYAVTSDTIKSLGVKVIVGLNDEEVFIAATKEDLLDVLKTPNPTANSSVRPARCDRYAWPMGKDAISIYEVPVETAAAMRAQDAQRKH